MKRRRPFGVTAIAALLALDGVVAALTLVLVAVDTITETRDRLSLDTSLSALGIAGLVTALGLLRLKRWAWVSTMLLVGANLVSVLVAYFDGQPRYLAMLLNVSIAFYLNQRSVQQAFHAQRQRGERP
jgi:hypothetical protein